jgi:hypothetical protein
VPVSYDTAGQASGHDSSLHSESLMSPPQAHLITLSPAKCCTTIPALTNLIPAMSRLPMHTAKVRSEPPNLAVCNSSPSYKFTTLRVRYSSLGTTAKKEQSDTMLWSRHSIFTNLSRRRTAPPNYLITVFLPQPNNKMETGQTDTLPQYRTLVHQYQYSTTLLRIGPSIILSSRTSQKIMEGPCNTSLCRCQGK